MESILNEDWTADVVGRMHRCKISNTMLAQECNYSAAYLSTVLNGKKALHDKESTKDRIYKALERIESRILTTGSADGVSTENPH